MSKIDAAGGTNFPSLNLDGGSTATPTVSGTPSVTLTATSGYQAILNIASNLEQLGLTAPLSAADAASALGELVQQLRQTLTQNHVFSAQNEDDAATAYLAQIEQYLLQYQSAQSALSAAQSQAQSDKDQIAANTASVGTINAKLTSNVSQIGADQDQIAALSSDASANSGAISTLEQSITDLNQSDTQLMLSARSLNAQNLSLQTDLVTQNGAVASASGDESSILADVGRVSQQFLGSPFGQSQDGEDSLSALVTLAERVPGDIAHADLHAAEARSLIQNDLDATGQATLALVANVGAILAAMASLGALAPQDGNASPQQISGLSATVVA